jgi:acyl-coenzyme A thioesterase PaaI-like protein
MDIQRDNFCFCCGADNERGLHLSITYPEPGSAETTLVVPDWFSGWRGVTHGGFLSTILDEIMAHACIGLAGPADAAVTAEMTVPPGSRIRATGRVIERKGRVIRTEGRLVGEDGQIAAEAKARFIATGKKTQTAAFS